MLLLSELALEMQITNSMHNTIMTNLCAKLTQAQVQGCHWPMTKQKTVKPRSKEDVGCTSIDPGVICVIDLQGLIRRRDEARLRKQ